MISRYSRPMRGGISLSSVPSRTRVGVSIPRIRASSSPSRSGPCSRSTSTACFLAISGSGRGKGGMLSGWAYINASVFSWDPSAWPGTARPSRMAAGPTPRILRRFCSNTAPPSRMAAGPTSTSASMGSGLRAAMHSASRPPKELPMIENAGMPSAAIAACSVSAMSNMVRWRVFSAELPKPGASTASTRKFSDSSTWAPEIRDPPPPCRATTAGPSPASR